MQRLVLIWMICASPWLADAQGDIELEGTEGKGYFLARDWGQLYYEVYGEGKPLLILHGNGGSVKGKHRVIPQFFPDYQVIAMDSRCHGKSSCPEGDLDYFEMAEDAFALMQALGHEKYTLWGHSDGGILGLILGYKYTDRIDRMLLSGANTKLSGLKPELLAMMENYEQIPDPQVRKHLALMINQKEIPLDSLKKVEVPVLLMVGDRDAVLMSHTMEIFESLPQSNLCVLPASSHFIEHEKPEQIVYWLKAFEKPFAAPSTIAIARYVMKSMMGED